MTTNSVAIAILTYRRPAYLEQALLSAAAQEGGVQEILVVDNAADAELQSWLRTRFPAIRYIAAAYNGGCEGRNVALRAAHASIVITIDDDVELVGTGCVARIRDAFAGNPKLACLNFKILTPAGTVTQRDWCHPRPITDSSERFETYFILEGECAVRREAVLEVGAYSARMFLYHEGLDLAYRLIDRGFRIEYTPEVAVIHHVAPDTGRAPRFYYCSARNGIWIAYQYLPAASAVLDVLEHTAKMTFFAARAGHLRAHLHGCVAAVRELPKLNRQPLKASSMARLKAMKTRRLSLAARVRRHLKERIL